MSYNLDVRIYQVDHATCIVEITAGSTVADIAVVEVCAEETGVCKRFAFECPRGKRCRGYYVAPCDDVWLAPPPPESASLQICGTAMYAGRVCNTIRVINPESTWPGCGDRGPCAYIGVPWVYRGTETVPLTATVTVRTRDAVLLTRTVRIDDPRDVIAGDDAEVYYYMDFHIDDIEREATLVHRTCMVWRVLGGCYTPRVRIYDRAGNVVFDQTYPFKSICARKNAFE